MLFAYREHSTSHIKAGGQTQKSQLLATTQKELLRLRKSVYLIEPFDKQPEKLLKEFGFLRSGSNGFSRTIHSRI